MKRPSQTEQTLDSIDDIQRAQMPAALRERILMATSGARIRVINLHQPLILLIAASLAMLIAFNVYTIAMRDNHTQRALNQAKNAGNPLAEEYFAPAPSI